MLTTNEPSSLVARSSSGAASGRSGTAPRRCRSRRARWRPLRALSAASSIPLSVASPRDFVRVSPSSALVQDAAAYATARTSSFAAAVSAAFAPSSRSTSPASVQIRVARIRFSVSVPVLSVQITAAAPSVSTALSRFTSAPRRASAATPTASASVIVGNSPSGTFATIMPIAKLKASCSGSPATSQPIGRNATPTTTATSAISQATRANLALEWAQLGVDAFRQRRDPAKLGLHPRGCDHRLPLAPDTARSAEDEIARFEHRPFDVMQCRRAVHRLRFARQRRKVDFERAVDELRVGGDPVALLEGGARRLARAPRASIGCRRPSRSTSACWGRYRRSASIARSA